MRITIINPDRDERVEGLMLQEGRIAAATGTHISCRTVDSGPRIINDAFTTTLASAAILEQIARLDSVGESDAYVIACFADPALHAAREISDRPVVGIGEASLTLARQVARRVSIIGVGPASRWVYEDAAARSGGESLIASIRLPRVSSNEIVDSGDALFEKVADEAEVAMQADDAEAVVLGCGAMVGMAARLQTRLGAPVIDPVRAGVALAESVLRTGVTTSKTLSYQRPIEVALAGVPDRTITAFANVQRD